MKLDLDRRGALKLGFGAALGALAGHSLEAMPDTGAVTTSCIIIWLRGGPSQLETFDPKPGHKNGGPTKALKTKTPGLILADSFPGLAERSDRFCILRSLTSTEGDHQRASYYVKTGNKPLAGLRHPSLGAVTAIDGPTGVLPAYVRIGQSRPGEPDQGYLDLKTAPFHVLEPGRPVPNLQPPARLGPERRSRRAQLLAALERASAVAGAGELVLGRRSARSQALALSRSEAAKAFLFDDEAKALRKYGDDPLGRGVLLARRLTERGVRCVEIVQDGWDTHQDNFNNCRRLGRRLDQVLSTLLDELQSRGRLKQTLVLCMGEFGRTPRINSRQGRDHFPRAFSALLAGHGVRAGSVVGQTSRDGMKVSAQPASVPDLFATCVKLSGLDTNREVTGRSGRPLKLASGRPIKALMAS